MATVERQTDSVVELALEGEITIASAAELKAELDKALRSGGDISIFAARATALDVTVVQLLWAAARLARRAGRRFTFADAVPEPILATWKEAGITVASILDGAS